MKSKNLHVGWTNPWVPPLTWAGAIFVLSSIHGSAYPRTNVPGADKIVHFILYAAMGVLCARALLLRGPAERRTRMLLVVAAAVLATLYGVSDELHQLLVPGRSADWRDALTDAVGALTGSIVAFLIWPRRRRTGPFR
jgi:VanZ family protein